MDSHLTMFFSLGYAIKIWRGEYLEVSHDRLRQMILIEQRNFVFSSVLMDNYQSANLSILRLN